MVITSVIVPWQWLRSVSFPGKLSFLSFFVTPNMLECICFKVMKAKGQKISPREIAEKIVQNIPNNELIERTEIAGPGLFRIS